MILGTGASPGIAMGKILLLQNQELIIENKIINDVDAEKTKFLKALDEFSMSPISILPARKLIHSLSYNAMKDFADTILTMSTSEEIESYIENNL